MIDQILFPSAIPGLEMRVMLSRAPSSLGWAMKLAVLSHGVWGSWDFIIKKSILRDTDKVPRKGKIQDRESLALFKTFKSKS